MASPNTRRWCFTLFNEDIEILQNKIRKLKAHTAIRYCVVQSERGANDKLHLQGFISFKNQARTKYVKGILGNNAEVSACVNMEESIAYCKKEASATGQIKEEWGLQTNSTGGGDYRANFGGRVAQVVDLLGEGKNAKEIGAMDTDLIPAMKLANEHFNEVRRIEKVETDRLKAVARMALKLHPWQKELKDKLDGPPDDREIIWIWEPLGRTGKSWFKNNYSNANPGEASFLTNGKTADMLHSSTKCMKARVFFLDLMRSTWTEDGKNFVNYQALEEIKNGNFASNKYDGAVYTRDSPHFVVFANCKPELKKLSLDRWCVQKIVDNKLCITASVLIDS